MSALVIEVAGLVKRFGAVTAVDGIAFQVQRGQCVGLLGPNGAGKTTTLEILEGIQRPTSGTVSILGMSWERDGEALRQRIGLALQETRFYEKLTVLETLQLFRSFYRSGDDEESLLEQVQLEEKRHAYVETLSGGQHQRLALAVGLVSRPDILFLDEPTTGLDPTARRSMWEVIAKLKASGTTIVLTTHYMEEAERLCDRIVLIDRGRIVRDGTVNELLRSLKVQQMVSLATHPPLSPEVVAQLPGIESRSWQDESWSLGLSQPQSALPALMQCLSRENVEVRHLTARTTSLDDVFVSLTGTSLDEVRS